MQCKIRANHGEKIVDFTLGLSWMAVGAAYIDI